MCFIGNRNFKPSRVHLLFEQSGTFKKAFKRVGVEAFDYDIIETEDVNLCCDIFSHVNNTISGKCPTLFDNIKKDDLVFAFFPCDYFTDQSQFISRGDSFGMRGWSLKERLQNSILQMQHRELYYRNLCKLSILAFEKNFPLIVENPYGKCNFLGLYFPIRPGVIVLDRREYGDILKKPTQFFFINCEPSFNLEQEYFYQKKESCRIENLTKLQRSLMTPKFADLFIKNWIL